MWEEPAMQKERLEENNENIVAPDKAYTVSEITKILNRNDESFGYKILERAINLEKTIHNIKPKGRG